MVPLLRRSLAPRGKPPVIRHRAKQRDKVSLLAALTVSPVRGCLGLYFQTYPDDYVTNVEAAAFLGGLLRRLRGKVVVVWDRGNMHKGPPIRELLRRYPRLTIEYLPPYAPDLNPVESLWGYLKYHKLVNDAPAGVAELDRQAQEHLAEFARDRSRLRSFWDHAELPLPDRAIDF
jgi:hypothetical protein